MFTLGTRNVRDEAAVLNVMSRKAWLRRSYLNKGLKEAREWTIQKSILRKGNSMCKGPEVGDISGVFEEY